MSDPTEHRKNWLKQQELAEVLLRELPDMKDEIELELQLNTAIVDVLKPAEIDIESEINETAMPEVEKKVPKLVIRKHITADDEEEGMIVTQKPLTTSVVAAAVKETPVAGTQVATMVATTTPVATVSVAATPFAIESVSAPPVTSTPMAATAEVKQNTSTLEELRRFRLSKKRATDSPINIDTEQSQKPVEKILRIEQEIVPVVPTVRVSPIPKSIIEIHLKSEIPADTQATLDDSAISFTSKHEASAEPIEKEILRRNVKTPLPPNQQQQVEQEKQKEEENQHEEMQQQQNQRKETQQQKNLKGTQDEQCENQLKIQYQDENQQQEQQSQQEQQHQQEQQNQKPQEKQQQQETQQKQENQRHHENGQEIQQQPEVRQQQQQENQQQQETQQQQESQQQKQILNQQHHEQQQQQGNHQQQQLQAHHQQQSQQEQQQNHQQQNQQEQQQHHQQQNQQEQQQYHQQQHHQQQHHQQQHHHHHHHHHQQQQHQHHQQEQHQVTASKNSNRPSCNKTNTVYDTTLPPEQLTPEEEALDQKLRASCTTFLQHLPCFKLQDNVPKCRECRRRSVGERGAAAEVYCRFYEFRRLEYDTASVLHVAGFPNPFTDPTPADLNVWQPDAHTEPTAGYMDIQVCRYILLHAGDQFCYLWRQEAEALKLHENPDTTIAWKKAVQGIREICDVCDTTLFNYHWTCDKCGFSACLNCFKDRKEKRTSHKQAQRGRDEYHWLLCSAQHQQHEQRSLILTQIIAGDALNVLGRLMHEVRMLWQVPQKCGCLLSKQQLPPGSALMATVQDMIKESQLKQRTSASSLATDATLRHQARMEKLHVNKLEFARARGLDYVPGRQWNKKTLGKDHITSAFDNFEHINFHRKGLAGLRRFLPPRAMTLAYSTQLAPGVPHEWLCDGKLLRLTDPMHPDNRILFEEVWKCGQPVMISEVARSLNLDLWRPEAFCHDFGDKPNDLINCLNGNLVPNQPMRHFWEGFQCIKKRLLDANGKPMLLKLKDWPPGDDFAEIMPTRYADLMKGLPMPEYTLRTGNLNIASCLPKMFVPPDLGPKMYNAYGSALHPDKGTTNLHLDISDAVNIMVYVGIPQDADGKSQLAATQRAIAMGGCDYLTRVRCQSPKVLPGALWHIFPARDADKIRDLLNRVTLEKGFRLEPDHDPIHDQNWYLDDKLRARLFKEYSVEGYPIVQCLGDAVFIPAGAPHQVQNLHNCIKVAEDFVSPENITHCYHLTHEFRQLSHSHTNHEDKLQIKNIIYHAIKDCCTILVRALEKRTDELSAMSNSNEREDDSVGALEADEHRREKELEEDT